MLLSALILPASAATITVGPSGDYATIGEAIAAAAPGDAIDVSLGQYTEDLAIGADLTITGNGSTLVGGIVVSAGVVDIGDLDITPTARAIDVRNAALALHGVHITGGTVSADGGASLLAVTATVTIADSTFEDGVAVGMNGGHIYATDTDLSVDRCSFTTGRSEKGGAIWANASTVTVRSSTFTDNAVRMDDEPSRGGAIRTQDTALVVQDSTFASNQAQDGYGGAIATFGGTLELTRCTVGTSEASSVGGALSLTDTPATLTDSTFTGNVVTADATGAYGYGGALIVNGTTAPLTTIDRCTFTSNISEAFGGAVRVEVGDVAISDSRFESNQSGYGGGIHFATTGAVTLERTDFVTNIGAVGSAIRWRPAPQTGSFAMHAGTVSGNATDGFGVLYLIDGAAVDIDAVTFDHNQAVGGGGAFVNNVPDVRVRHSLFCGNTVSGNATQSDGAGALVYLSGAIRNEWTNNLFVENVAGANGGGLRLLNSGSASVINNMFLGNQADFGGGAIASGTGLLFQNNVVAWSTAGDGLQADVGSAAVVTYDAFFDNVADPVGDSLDPLAMDPTVLDADPGLIAYTADGDCTNDDFHPRADSPLLDAGDPNQLDPDGSRSDIGAYGGPDATVIPDTDNDGVPDPDD
jgi:predicted outer membrane repeat protein